MTPGGLPSTSSAGPSSPVVPGTGVGDWARTRAKLPRAAMNSVECIIVVHEVSFLLLRGAMTSCIILERPKNVRYRPI